MAKKGPVSEKHAAILKALQYLNAEQRKSILKKADTSFIKCLVECVLNTLNGNIPIDKSCKIKLRKYIKNLRRLTNNRGTWKAKKRIIVQQGGMLNALLPIIASVLSAYIL